MEEAHSTILVADGAIKNIKLSLSTEEEIVSFPSLMLLTSNSGITKCTVGFTSA